MLLTPFHTGTHFVRLLLELHPAISFACAEDYRIDPALGRDCILPGLGAGWIDDSVGAYIQPHRGRMVYEYFEDVLYGRITPGEFSALLKYRDSLFTEETFPWRVSEFMALQMAGVYASLGISLDAKRVQWQLYRGHWQQAFAGCDLRRKLESFRVVTTIRHPLRSILSILRRHSPAEHASLIAHYFSTVRAMLSLPDAFVFCTDLWQDTPPKMCELFSHLDLPVTESIRQFLVLRPRVNITITSDDQPNQVGYSYEYRHADDFLRTLNEARRALDDRVVHPVMKPYWDELRDGDLRNLMEGFGYDLAECSTR
ncbi:MAG: hypothetical protein JWN70_440 [Planctomycetaceae bacterium]|nr:hypothetical protein [Planctomycetaceae bacterium]